MTYIILDIETRPCQVLIQTYLDNLKAPKNYKDEEKISQYLASKKADAMKELSIDQDYSEIVCIGVKIDDEPAKLVQLEDLKELLKSNVPVTFNGKNFDVPIIIKQGIRKGVDLPYSLLREKTKKWQYVNHIDLMELISFGGDYKSLDQYAQIYLGEKKVPIDFLTCSQKELEEHCLADCEMEYRLFNKFKDLI